MKRSALIFQGELRSRHPHFISRFLPPWREPSRKREAYTFTWTRNRKARKPKWSWQRERLSARMSVSFSPSSARRNPRGGVRGSWIGKESPKPSIRLVRVPDRFPNFLPSSTGTRFQHLLMSEFSRIAGGFLTFRNESSRKRFPRQASAMYFSARSSAATGVKGTRRT